MNGSPLFRFFEVIAMTLGGVWQGVRQDWNLLELALIMVGYWAIAKRGWRPNLAWKWSPGRPWLWAIGIAGGAVALRLALVPVLSVPVPLVPDEFSHLLLADTLLHGRVANPAHPYWQHFESFNIIQRPAYASIYFPGHAAILAAGVALLQSAWAGVLAESACFSLALFWALRGWLPARWALFGTLMAALRFAIASYWVNAYHGGFLAATGGALIAGAFVRLRKKAAIENAMAMGVGLAILAFTRPFEGFFFALPFLGMLAWGLRQKAGPLVKIAVPVLLIGGCAVAGLGMYFKGVTGHALVTPYSVHQKEYGWPMGFPWMAPRPVEQRTVEFQRYYDFEVTEHEKVDGPVDFIEYLTFRMQEYWRFFLGPVLSVPLVFLGCVWRRRRWLFIGMAGALAVLVESAGSPHYLAPATVMIVGIVVECCRHLNASRVKIVPLLPATMALVLILRIAAQGGGLPYTQKLNYQSWCCRVEGNRNRARITAELLGAPGDHLVFVKPKSDPYNLLQWIYNSADIDRQRIVWARDLGAERDAQLAEYYHGRTVWLLDPNVNPATYQRYAPTQSALQLQTQLPPPGHR